MCRNVKERDHLEDLDVDMAIILKFIANKWVRQARTGLIWLRIRTGGVPLQCCAETAVNFLSG